ncbi:MAG TPA: carbohydrate porin, partial [Thermodesulfobacteriota bacterium]|nr:carbohydrate porin [Thermodesulfobacteriota bacterium]
NAAVDQNPISIQYNIPAFLSNPDSALGARVRVQPSGEFYLAAGAYNADPDAARNGDVSINTDFTFAEGVILVSEAGYTPDGGSSGLKGEYKLGAYYDTGQFDELSDAEETRNGNYGFYVIASQMVYAEPSDVNQGLTLWGASTFAPEDDINLFPFFLSGGFSYEGPLPGRNEDTAAFGIAYGKISPDFEDGDYEIGIEGTYIIQLTPWLDLQPDLQYIIHPGGSSGIPNALVAGMQLSLNI